MKGKGSKSTVSKGVPGKDSGAATKGDKMVYKTSDKVIPNGAAKAKVQRVPNKKGSAGYENGPFGKDGF